jgi:hypothetical protein
MIIDVRYHVASLVAVFLALALGILMGMSLLNGQSVLEKQQELVDSLRVDFEKLKEDNDTLQAHLSQLDSKNISDEKFMRALLPGIVKEKLVSTNYLIVRTNTDVDLNELASSIVLSGGSPEMVITFKDDFTEILQKHAEKYSDLLKLEWQNSEDDAVQIVELLCAQLVNFESDISLELLEQLQNDGAVSYSGRLQSSPEGIILVGGASSESNNLSSVDLPLIVSFREQGMMVVGVEEYLAPESYIKEYRKKGISTVDNIDSVVGLISLIAILRGEEGNYGLKGGSSALMPAMDSWITK